jgi:hypothetical protein
MEQVRRLSVRELPVTSEPGRRRHKALLRYPRQLVHPHQTLFFELQGEHLPPPPERHDYLVLALLFFAMRHATDLHVEGRVSRELLINLEEFQRAWCAWRPDVYRPIRISCDEELEPAAPSPWRRGVVALSGGVDGTFSMLQHLPGTTARDRCELVTAMLVHGLEIPLEAERAFELATENAAAVTAQANLPLALVRTDWRQNFSLAWEDDFCTGLAACLNLFSGTTSCGLLGSDEDYAHLAFPWGSNAITNPMMSSDRFRIITVGGAAGRSAKVAEIARHEGIAKHLRVCWRAAETGKNCGRCEKCVRTKLNFLVNGVEPPAALGAVPGVRDVLALSAQSATAISYLVDVRDAARSGKLSPGMRLAVQACLAKNRLLLPFRGWRPALRRVFRWFTPWRKKRP